MADSLKPDEKDLAGKPPLARRIDIALRFAGVVLSGVPTTSVPPMAVTYFFYHRFGDEERYQRMHRVLEWADFCTKHVLEMDVRMEGMDRIPADRSRTMFVSNHQSFVDIPMIMSSMRIGAFLSKDTVGYIPVIGQIAWLAGTIYFDRKSPASRKKALSDVLDMCERSTAVHVFPEGTRSQDGNLSSKVHKGALEAAWERGLRLGTFAFHGTRYACPPAMDRFYPGQRVALVAGRTFDPGDFGDGASFADAAWEEVGRRFAEARALREAPGWEKLPTPLHTSSGR